MGKPSTDPGLGPTSEARVKAASARDVDTQPAPANVKPKTPKRDTVDVLLDGFNERSDQPRILPTGSDTPSPPVAALRKDLTPTQPGRRHQEKIRVAAGVALGFLIVLALGALLVNKIGADATPRPNTTATLITSTQQFATPTGEPTAAQPTATTAPTPSDNMMIAPAVSAAPLTTTTKVKPSASPTPTAKTPHDPRLVHEN